MADERDMMRKLMETVDVDSEVEENRTPSDYEGHITKGSYAPYRNPKKYGSNDGNVLEEDLANAEPYELIPALLNLVREYSPDTYFDITVDADGPIPDEAQGNPDSEWWYSDEARERAEHLYRMLADKIGAEQALDHIKDNVSSMQVNEYQDDIEDMDDDINEDIGSVVSYKELIEHIGEDVGLDEASGSSNFLGSYNVGYKIESGDVYLEFDLEPHDDMEKTVKLPDGRFISPNIVHAKLNPQGETYIDRWTGYDATELSSESEVEIENMSFYIYENEQDFSEGPSGADIKSEELEELFKQDPIYKEYVTEIQEESVDVASDIDDSEWERARQEDQYG